jgi:flagellar protein FliS
MLMGGAIERLIQAKAAMEQGNIPVKGERIGKALDIIIALRSCLSMDDGGDIAKNLDQLYEFMIGQITEANHENNPQPIDDVIEIIREIKSAWDQIPANYHNLTAQEVGI